MPFTGLRLRYIAQGDSKGEGLGIICPQLLRTEYGGILTKVISFALLLFPCHLQNGFGLRLTRGRNRMWGFERFTSKIPP